MQKVIFLVIFFVLTGYAKSLGKVELQDMNKTTNELNDRVRLENLITQHQVHYIEFFEKASKNCTGALEVLLDPKNSDKEEIYRLHRFDCLERNEKGEFSIIEYNQETFINHDKSVFNINHMEIEFEPILWNGVEIDIFGFNNIDILKKWISKWLDIEDSRKISSNNFSGLIHNIQPPKISSEKISLAIDFGTSNSDAMIELIEILSKNGTKKIRL